MSRGLLGRALGSAALLALAACAVSAPEPWRHQLSRDHPLVGRIWEVAGGRFIPEAELVRRLIEAEYVMLGEKHDNLDHHRLQARMLRAMVAAGRRPATGFEMLTSDQAAALAAHLEARPGDAAGIGAAVNWGTSGWPDLESYRPIAQAALDGGLALVAAGLPRTLSRRMVTEGLDVLEPERRARLGLEAPLAAATLEAMAEELRRAHCNELPESMVPGMVMVQRTRDAVMADTLVRAAEAGANDGGVLITGNGHARGDRGVPAAIARLRPGTRRFSLAFMEVEPGLDDLAAYARAYGAGALPFDAVWFTPRVDDEDPCERLRKRHEKATSQE